MNKKFENQKLDILKRKHVVAVGKTIVNGEEIIEVSVAHKIPKHMLSAQDLVPLKVSGKKTNVTETGYFDALGVYTDRMRPVPGGYSCGHHLITAGTLGMWVQKGGKWHILSNNHVLANSNDAEIGDPIYQPGVYDGGNSNDEIAKLSHFVPINFGGGSGGGGCPIAKGTASFLNKLASLINSSWRMDAYQPEASNNLVDAALAEVNDPEVVKNSIVHIGDVKGMNYEIGIGDFVKKSGRTTGYKEGQVMQTDVTVMVNYGGAGNATFTDQIMTSNISEGGDSGSAVLNYDNECVALLFAGSPNETIVCKIGHVQDALGFTL